MNRDLNRILSSTEDIKTRGSGLLRTRDMQHVVFKSAGAVAAAAVAVGTEAAAAADTEVAVDTRAAS